jgi:ATP-dependent DNA ligase
MQTEHKKRQGFMLCYPFEEKRLHKWSFPVLVQPKLDGVRCGVSFSQSGDIILKSSTQEDIISVPHINAFIEEFFQEQNLTVPELDGELYLHGLSFEDIYSITGRTVNFHPEFHKIEFHCFDLKEFSTPQFIRTMKLRDYFNVIPPSAPLKLVKTFPASSFDDIWNLYQAFLTDGYEGIIVREINNLYLPRRSNQVMKFKPKKDDWYTVIGTQEEIDKNGTPKNRLGALVCLGSSGDTFTVGSGLTDKERDELWGQDLTGWLCHVQYQSTFSGRGVPRFPVFMELVQPEKALHGVIEMNGNTD